MATTGDSTEAKLRRLEELREQARHAGGERAVERQRAQGKMLARERLEALLSELKSWTSLRGLAPFEPASDGPSRASYLASTLSASLDLVKEGMLEARQMEAFADVYLRARKRKEPA